MKFRSLVPGWTILFVVFPLLLILVAFAVQRRVTAPAWPFCTRCDWMRSWRRGIALGTLALAVAFIAYAFIAGRNEAGDGEVAAFLIGLLLLLLGLLALVRSSLGRIANGYVTSDASALEFRKPNAEFTRQIADAKEAAARRVPDPA